VIVFFPGVSGGGRPAQTNPDLWFHDDNFNGTGLNGSGGPQVAGMPGQNSRLGRA
jgi:hypothetical protein